MSLFTSGQRALLEQLMQKRRHELESRLHQQGLGRAEQAREVLLQDGDDAPQRDADREVSLALTDLEHRELTAIGEALQRLHQDEAFGHCADCQAVIPFDRLKLEPWASRCAPCETALEARRGGVPRATL